MKAPLCHPIVVWWHDMDRWVVPSSAILTRRLPTGWVWARVGDVVKLVSNAIKVESNIEYKMAGVKWYGEGVFHRETMQGDTLSARWVSPLVPGALIYNRLFAWKASFAVVPANFADCHVSNEFPQFVADPAKLLPEYLYLWCITDQTIKGVNAASTGSAAVSRNRFREEFFLDFKIPLPPILVQQKIVAAWETAQRAAAEMTARIEQLERDIEARLLDSIGVHVEAPSVGRHALVATWSDVERWDLFYHRLDFLALERSLNAISAVPLGEALRFISRGWRNSDFPEGTFRYVEISNVTKEDGIGGFRVVSVDKPPSRATTLIRKGEMILGMTRPYLGSFALVPTEYDRCVCSSGFALCAGEARPDVMLEYALEFLKSSAGLRQMERRMTGGLYPAITQDELEKVLLPIPPLPVQRQVVAYVSEQRAEITKLKAEAKARAEAAKADVEAMILGSKKVSTP